MSKKQREKWSDWACQALHDVGSDVQGLVRASLHAIASSGDKPSAKIQKIVEEARKK